MLFGGLGRFGQNRFRVGRQLLRGQPFLLRHFQQRLLTFGQRRRNHRLGSFDQAVLVQTLFADRTERLLFDVQQRLSTLGGNGVGCRGSRFAELILQRVGLLPHPLVLFSSSRDHQAGQGTNGGEAQTDGQRKFVPGGTKFLAAPAGEFATGPRRISRGRLHIAGGRPGAKIGRSCGFSDRFGGGRKDGLIFVMVAIPAGVVAAGL